MSAPVLTVFTDAAPCPRVEVFFPSFDAGTVSVTVFRISGGREFQVRGAVRAATAGSLSRIDFEVPFNEAVSYRAEQFDAAGVSLGFTPTTTLGDAYGPWVEAQRNLVASPFGQVALPNYGSVPQQTVTGNISLTSFSALPVTGHPTTGLRVVIPAAAATGGGVDLSGALAPGDYVASAWVNRQTGAATAFGFALKGWRALDTARTFTFNVWTYVEVAFTVAPGEAGAVVGWRNTVTDAAASNFYLINMQVAPAGQSVPQGGLVVCGATAAPDVLTRLRWVGAVNASDSVRETRVVSGLGVVSAESWMHNPLDPQGSVQVFFGDDSSWKVTRPTPGVVSHPKGRRVGVVLSEPRQGVTGLQLTVRTSNDADADKVQVMCGDNGMPPVLCIRLGSDDKRLRIPKPLFLSALVVAEVDMNTRWGGTELAHMVDGDEVSPPIPGLFVPLLTRADLNAFFATRAALNAGGLTRSDINRRYDLAGTAG